MNQVKTRLQSLGLLDRAFANLTDDQLIAARDALGEEHREAFDELVNNGDTADAIREAITGGRLDGTLESVTLIITDACLADCIEQLGDAAEHPSTEQLQEVLPGLIERHGKELTQLMLASTVAGEAPAAAIIRSLLKHDDVVKLPPAVQREITPLSPLSTRDSEERAAIRERRKEIKAKKQAEARARREQAKQPRKRKK